MDISSSHKKLTAGLLLLLYSFIATPVHFWHHHNTVGKGTVSAQAKQQLLVKKAAGQASEANCSICAHQYSVYYKDAALPLHIVPLIVHISYERYSSAIDETPFSYFSNKGPPAIG